MALGGAGGFTLFCSSVAGSSRAGIHTPPLGRNLASQRPLQQDRMVEEDEPDGAGLPVAPPLPLGFPQWQI